MEQEPEITGGAENIANAVERGSNYLAQKETELAGLENIRPEIIAKARIVFDSIGG